MSQTIVFVSTCPNCKRQQPQEGFTVEILARLLNGGFPIEAYCVICDVFWPVSLSKRIELSEAVAATPEGMSALQQNDDLPRRPNQD
jgi:hypothetical protein